MEKVVKNENKESEIEKKYKDIFLLAFYLVKENTELMNMIRRLSLTIGVINIVVLVFILAGLLV